MTEDDRPENVEDFQSLTVETLAEGATATRDEGGRFDQVTLSPERARFMNIQGRLAKAEKRDEKAEIEDLYEVLRKAKQEPDNAEAQRAADETITFYLARLVVTGKSGAMSALHALAADVMQNPLRVAPTRPTVSSAPLIVNVSERVAAAWRAEGIIPEGE